MDLNEKEIAVVTRIREAGRRGIHLSEVARDCFPGVGHEAGSQGNSWARNSLRRPLKLGLIRQVGPGTYAAVPALLKWPLAQAAAGRKKGPTNGRPGLEASRGISPSLPELLIATTGAPTAPAAEPARDILESELRRAVPRFRGFTCPEQAEIARSYLEGVPPDVLGVLPTGMGKSLCFLLPTYLWKKNDGRALTVVVSPILALMQDQIDRVELHNNEFGDFQLTARQLNSLVSPDERREVRKSVRAGEVNVLYLGPETLVQPWTYEILADAARNRILRGIVIDEAHMVAEWGDQFRTAFKRIGPVRRIIQEASPSDSPLRTLVLTATLPTEERREVLRSLGCDPDMKAIEHRAIRSEHVLTVRKYRNHEEKLAAVTTEVRQLRRAGTGIVYCAQRRHCEEIASLLERSGLGPARHFHGGTPGHDRLDILREFRDSSKLVVVATDAFGLGVDKRDVRWVLHFSMPDSIDQYYQEIGRGGRDGKPCHAVLYYAPVDRGQAKRNALNVLTTEKFDSRLRSMLAEAVNLYRGPNGRFKLVEEETIPNYVGDADGEGPNRRSVRLHKNWNYAVLIRAEQLGWIRLSADVLHRVSCQLNPRRKVKQAAAVAPTLAKAGLLDDLTVDAPTVLELGVASAKLKVPPRVLQQEFFDLLFGGVVRLADKPHNLWDTRILVEHLGRFTARMGEDRELRLGRQQRDGRQVDLMAAYAKSRECRRVHFYRAYRYDDLIPGGGCGACDICASTRPVTDSSA